MSSAEAVSKHRQKRKNQLVKIIGGKCCVCGYSKAISALEFHHLNPSQKEYQLSSGNCRSIQEDLKEAKKCILVCSNCHKEIHQGLIDNTKLKSSFNEEIAQEVLNEYQDKKIKKEKVCPRCGKVITRTAQYCENCFNELRKEKNAQIRPSREELKKLIRTTSFVKIGEQYCVTDNAIRKWCDAYNLPRTKKEINSYSNDQWSKI